MDREVVEDTPERLQGDDVLHDQGQAAFVRTSLTMFVMVEGPGVLEWRRTHATEHCELAVFTFGGALSRSDIVGVLSDRGEAIDLECRESRHPSCCEFQSGTLLSS